MARVRPLRPQRLAVREALHCRLAEDVRSDRDQPPTDRSAMDGYAVIAADLKRGPARLKLVGEIAAGTAAPPPLRPGTCVAILTGGSLPARADAVVPIENATCDGDAVSVHIVPAPGAYVRKRGEEAARGDRLLRKGSVLGPAQIGVCSMVGRTSVKVYPRPTVAVLSTGTEVRTAGHPVGAHQLRDANGPAILAALAELEIRDVRCRIVPDNVAVLAARLKRASQTHDVVILTGGVSVGRYDFVPEAIRQIGGKIRFRGVKMKPGKPQLYATLPGNRHLFGLPGNPVSALTGFHEFVAPALRRLAAAPPAACRPTLLLRLAAPTQSAGAFTTFIMARVMVGEDGASAALPLKSIGSADLIAACEADGMIVIPDGAGELPAGARVEFHPWRRFP